MVNSMPGLRAATRAGAMARTQYEAIADERTAAEPVDLIDVIAEPDQSLRWSACEISELSVSSISGGE